MNNVIRVLLSLAAVTWAGIVSAEDLRIIGEDKVFVATLESGETVNITRQMTPCAKNKGWLQPLVPEPGIVPVTEIEVLNAINDDDFILVDMRTQEWFLDATIPGSVNIPYTEVAMRMDELGCSKGAEGWDCSGASKVLGFLQRPRLPPEPHGHAGHDPRWFSGREDLLLPWWHARLGCVGPHYCRGRFLAPTDSMEGCGRFILMASRR